MVQKALRIGLTVGLLLFALGGGRGDEDEDPYRASLRGLQGVSVIVEQVDPDAEAAGVSAQALKENAEKLLRTKGIRVLSRSERLKTPGGPMLYVNINTLPEAKTGLYSYNIDVSLRQLVVLARSQSHVTVATTWDTGILGQAGKKVFAEAVRVNLEKGVDDFADAFRALNPAAGPPAP